MVLVLAETEKFQRPFATASIERIIILARTFMNEPKLRQKFCRRTFPPFPCLSPANRCDQSNAFSFCDSQSPRVEIQSRVSAKVGRAVLCAPIAIKNIGAHGSDAPYHGRKPTENRRRSYSATKRAKIGFSFCVVASGHNFRSVTNAVSNAECSGQFGSLGIRGMTSAMTLRAVSAFASR